MSNFTSQNLIDYTGTIQSGQRLLKRKDGSFLPIGISNSLSSSSNTISTINFYRCTSVNDSLSAWAGQKAILSGGKYIYQEEVTSGLTYDIIRPTINNIYSENLSTKIVSYDGIPTDYIFNSELLNSNGWEGNDSSVIQDQILNRPVFSINTSNGYFVYSQENLNLPHGTDTRSMSFWCRKMDNVSNGWAGIGYGNGYDTGVRFTFGIKDNYPVFTAWADDNFQTAHGLIEDSNWHHYVLILQNSDQISLYKDGILTFTYTSNSINTIPGYIHVGDYYQQSYAPIARFSKLKIYNRVLSSNEIQKLYNEFF